MMGIMLVNGAAEKMPLADEEVHLVITSVPYWSLRDYGLEPRVWGEQDCEHVWGEWCELHDIREETQHGKTRTTGRFYGDESRCFDGNHQKHSVGAVCQLCGAWLGCLGLEPLHDCGGWVTGQRCNACYVCHIVEVFKEVKRVLRRDGLAFLNISDSYSSGRRTTQAEPGGIVGQPGMRNGRAIRPPVIDSLKPKDLCLIPSRVALALQSDGWWVRSVMPWPKLNSLPESVRDRPSTSHEYWLMLAKAKRYFWDGDAVRVGASASTIKRASQGTGKALHSAESKIMGADSSMAMGGTKIRIGRDFTADVANGRNRRTSDTFYDGLDALIVDQRRYLAHLLDVRENGGMLVDEQGEPLALCFNTKPYKGAHYAVFNPDMIEPLIRGGTSERGVCPECGAPWVRVVERETWREKAGVRDMAKTPLNVIRAGWRDPKNAPKMITTAWLPTCHCYGKPERGPVPCPKCQGSGQGKATHTGSTDSTYSDKSTAGRLALLQQAAREQGSEYDSSFAGVETGEPCAKCKGACTVVGDIWPDDVGNWPTVPAIVLDPFIGSGTTCLVARKLGRDSIGLDLSLDYLQNQARPRLQLDVLSDWEKGKKVKEVEVSFGDLPLFGQS